MKASAVNVACGRQRYYIGATAIGKRKLRSKKRPANAPLQLGRDRRLVPAEGALGILLLGNRQGTNHRGSQRAKQPRES